MATEKNTDTKTKGLPVTGVVSPEMREAIEAHRWANRKTVSEVVRDAFDAWARENKIKVATPAPGE